MVLHKKFIVGHLKKRERGYYRLSGLMYLLYVSSGFCSKILRKLYSGFGRGLSVGGVMARLFVRIGKDRQSIRFARMGLRLE